MNRRLEELLLTTIRPRPKLFLTRLSRKIIEKFITIPGTKQVRLLMTVIRQEKLLNSYTLFPR